MPPLKNLDPNEFSPWIWERTSAAALELNFCWLSLDIFNPPIAMQHFQFLFGVFFHLFFFEKKTRISLKDSFLMKFRYQVQH